MKPIFRRMSFALATTFCLCSYLGQAMESGEGKENLIDMKMVNALTSIRKNMGMFTVCQEDKDTQMQSFTKRGLSLEAWDILTRSQIEQAVNMMALLAAKGEFWDQWKLGLFYEDVMNAHPNFKNVPLALKYFLLASENTSEDAIKHHTVVLGQIAYFLMRNPVPGYQSMDYFDKAGTKPEVHSNIPESAFLLKEKKEEKKERKEKKDRNDKV